MIAEQERPRSLLAEQIMPKEPLSETPKSVFIVAHPVWRDDVKGALVMAALATRLKHAGVGLVGLGYRNERQNEVLSLIPQGTIDLQQLPEGIFDPELSSHWLLKRFKYFRASRTFRDHLKSACYERIAVLAENVRYLGKDPKLSSKQDKFPQDPYAQDQSIVDFFTDQLAHRYLLSNKVDNRPADFSIPARSIIDVAATAKKAGFNLSTPFWAINVGTGWPDETWPFDQLITLTKRLHEQTSAPVVLTNPPVSFRQRQSLTEKVEELPHVCLFDSNKPSEMAALLQNARVYIGQDDGWTQLAAALGTDLIAAFPQASRNLWKPIPLRNDQEIAIVSAETMKEVTCKQVMAALEANSRFFENFNG